MKALLVAMQLMALWIPALPAIAQVAAPSRTPGPDQLTVACKSTVAPITGEFIAQGTNRGVAPSGFVFRDASKSDIQGVDVSKWQQDINPFVVKRCGGQFAYVRISAGRLGFNEIAYPSTWGQVRAAHLFIGAYHYLTFFPESIEFHQLKPNAPPNQIVAEFEKLGHQQADLFIQRFKVLHDDDLKHNPNARFLPPMVAIHDMIGLPPPFAAIAKKEWFYATLCAFVNDVEKQPWMHGKTVVIFTDPGAFQQRDYANAPCLKSTQHTYWVQYPTPGATWLPEAAQDSGSALVNALCHAPGDTRQCLFQQYTNRGGLPMGSLSEGLDLSRYVGTKSLRDLSVGG